MVSGNRAGIIHVGNGTEPQSIDPHVVAGTPEIAIVRTLFEGLVTINPYTLEPEPGVAMDWTFSDDRKVVTFHLNPQARWSNGDPITAEDFVWSWRRSLDPTLGNVNAEFLYPVKNAEAYATGTLADPAELGIRALDAHTLQITLEHPTPYLFLLLDNPSTYPVHRATIEKFGEATDRFTGWTRAGNIVSNGPFRLKRWQINRRFEVEKDPGYWNADRVRLNGIVFHPIESGTLEERMFRAGQLHYTQSVPLGKIAAYRDMDPSPYQQSASFASYYYLFNTARPPVDDVRVRQALALSVDREKLVTTVLQNVYLPLYSLIPPGVPGYDPPQLFAYDPERARRLLADAGYPGGHGFPGIEVIYNTLESHRQIAVALQQMWQDTLNIKVTLTNMEWRVYLDMTEQKNYTVARAGRQWTMLDPSTALSIFLSDSGNNSTGFASAEFDDLVLRTAPQAATPERRFALFRQAEALLLEQMPIIPLFIYTNRHLVHPSVHGAPGNLVDQLNFRHVWLEQPGTKK